MYDYIIGKLVHKQETSKGFFLTLENSNIGYLIGINSKTMLRLPEINTDIKIYTILLHKEDNMSLCGFLNKEDRDIFKILTSVSGVGPKMALFLLNEFESYELISLVLKGEYKELTKAKGIGPKLAQKIILELKDKLINFQSITPLDLTREKTSINEQSYQEAHSVLISLGYDNEEIKKALSSAIQNLCDKEDTENILKETLKILSM